jgi:hypothetical protein
MQPRDSRHMGGGPAAGEGWPLCIRFAIAAADQSSPDAGIAAVVILVGFGCRAASQSLPPCFSTARAPPRIRPKLSLPIGFTASRSPARRKGQVIACYAAHRREIVKRLTTRRIPRAAIGSLSKVNGSRYRPIRSCSARITQQDTASPACVITMDIQSGAVLSGLPKGNSS